jgi:hypothetical protein
LLHAQVSSWSFVSTHFTSRERRPNLNLSAHAVVFLAIVNIGLDRSITSITSNRLWSCRSFDDSAAAAATVSNQLDYLDSAFLSFKISDPSRTRSVIIDQRSTAAVGLHLVSNQGLYMAAMQSSTTRSASGRVVVVRTSPN